MIAVFLPNGLIGIDSFAPVLMELRRRDPKREIVMYCFRQDSFDLIRRNPVLWDVVQEVGEFVQVGRKKKGFFNWLAHRVRLSTTFIRWILMGMAGKADFVHFGHLHYWPFRLLYLVNRARTYFCQYSYPMTPPTIDEFRLKVGHIKRRVVNELDNPASGVVVALHPQWKLLDHPALQTCPRHVLGWPQMKRIWTGYILSKADAYLGKEFERAGIQRGDQIVSYFLGNFAPDEYFARDPVNTMRLLLDETLDLLLEAADGVRIFVKPHYLDGMELAEKAIAARPKGRFILTHLHAAALATRSSFFVANYSSGVFADGRCFRVPTIEYTDYSDECLAFTKGRSLWPDYVTHFIQRDRSKFLQIASALLRVAPAARGVGGEEWEDGGFFDRVLSRGRSE